MPDYIMPSTGDIRLSYGDIRLSYGDLPAFVRGYIEAAFFTDANEDQYPEPLHVARCNNHGKEYTSGVLASNLTFGDIRPEALAGIIESCGRFQEAAGGNLALAYGRDDYTPEQAGRDFWFTRNGHGVGFWDRKQLGDGGVGESLSSVARGLGAVYFEDWF